MNKKDLYKDKNWLTQQYWGFNLTLKQMEELSDCTNIGFWMRKYNIPRKTNSQAVKETWSRPEFKKIQHDSRVKSWKNNTKRKEGLRDSLNSSSIIQKRTKAIKQHYKDPKNLEKISEQNRRTAKKRSKTMKERYKNPQERQRISELTKIGMSKPETKKKMKADGERRRGKSIEELGHKPDCSCTICMQKRGDISWMTEEVRNKKSQTRKMNIKQNPEKWKKVYIKAGEEAFKANKQNKPYIWNGVHFMSKLELECAKLLLTEPIDGVNCNVMVNGKSIDFFPQKGDRQYIGYFVEYHPWDFHGLSTEEYYNQRKEAIDNSDYNSVELVVITNLNELKEDKQ